MALKACFARGQKRTTSRRVKAKAGAEPAQPAPPADPGEPTGPDEVGEDRHSEVGKDNKKVYSKLNYRLKNNPEAQETFRKLDYKSKQQWLEKFKLDPSMAWLEAEQETSVGAEEKNSNEVLSLTLEQLASPNYLNSEVHAKAVFEAMPKKPHEVKALADIGVEVVEWNRAWKTVSDWHREQVKVRAIGELDEDTYKEAE